MASKLIHAACHEADNPTEVSLREAFEALKSQLVPPFSLKIPTPQEYLNLNHAILFGILSEPVSANIHIKHLHGKVTDGYNIFTNTLTKVVHDLYPKLVDSAKVQLIWVTTQMVCVSAVGVEGLLVALLRQIICGDLSEGNLWLCSELVTLFLSRWDCLLEEEPMALLSGLYTFLRLLSEHSRSSNARLEVLKKMEIIFCVRMLRDHFSLSFKIGRDLVRLLLDLAHIPEFRDIWRDLLLNPGEFKTNFFHDISQLYSSRTSSRYFLLRITPEMETQLRFLLTHVKLGNQKRYQTWFANKFLSVPERETLITDVVRFICCSHHPPNEIIQSAIIPRWAVIGWLLTSCQKSSVEASTKLALFYDWLFFDEKVDNIMNIEPAILLMVNSIPRYVDVTRTLLEFLFNLMDKYDVERKEMIDRGVMSAFRMVLQKGVVQSLDGIMRFDGLSPVIKQRLQLVLAGMKASLYKELLQPTAVHSLSVPHGEARKLRRLDREQHKDVIGSDERLIA